MAQPQTVRSSVWGLMRAQPTAMDDALILPTAWSAFRPSQPAVKRLPPPR